MSVSGWLNGSNQQTTSTLAPFMQFVAKWHTDPTLNISYNAAGEDAIEEAMACIWADDHITLSSVFLNERFSGVEVVPYTLRQLKTGGAVIDTLTFHSQTVVCSSIQTMLFNSSATNTSVHVPVQAYGYDWVKDLGASGIIPSGACKRDSPYNSCYDAGGTCRGELTSESFECTCTAETGACVIVSTPGVVLPRDGSNSVIRWGWF